MPRAPVIYQESRLSIAPASPSQVLHINTGGLKHSALFGAGRKRNFDEVGSLDEEGYTRKHLATEASVFFRRSERAPRSFLWRVLEDGKLLEIQSVDLIHDAKGAGKDESKLTFRVGFKDAILKNGVAFADAEDTDALDCFVLTSGRELYTITLKKDLLTRDLPPLDFDPSTCFRRFAPSVFNHRYPYRFVAVSSHELLITLHDGGFLRLERKPNETGAQWRESLFSEHTWGNTLRGMMTLKRQQGVRYGDLDLYPSAIAAAAKSPDGKHFWTVSLEHELRVWNTETGKAISTMDLLDERIDEEPRKQQRHLLAAEQGTLLQIVSAAPPPKNSKSVTRMDVDDEFAYYIVVHSPKEHEFKLFGVSSYTTPEGEAPRLEDLQPGFKFVPPIDELLKSNVWHLEEFCVKPGPGWQGTKLWIRARSGTSCRIFSVVFDVFNSKNQTADVQKKWTDSWTIVDPGVLTSDRLRECVGFPGLMDNVAGSNPTATEKWLDYLFYPGRFSEACLESAVHVYRKARNLPQASSKSLTAPESGLRQRLLQAVESKVMLIRQSDDGPDFAKYANDIQAQWKTFYSLLSHLHNKRNESVALAFDAYEELAWSVCADLVGPICESSSSHLLLLNAHLVTDDRLSKVDETLSDRIFSDEEDVTIALVMAAAKSFRSSLSPEFSDKFARSIVSDALYLELVDTDASSRHISSMYESHGFSDEVMDDDFQALTDAAEGFGGLGSLDLSSFLGVLEKMDQEDDKLRGRNAEKSLGRYGDRLTIGIVQDTMERHRGILLDVINLAVFMIGDLDQAELHPEFVTGVGELLEATLMRMRHTELILWLTSNLVPEPQEGGRRTSMQHEGVESQTVNASSTTAEIPLLLRLFIAGWKATPSSGQALARLFTQWSHSWIHELDLSRQWEGLTAYVFSSLLKGGFNSLATDFTKFLDQSENATTWLWYLQGRHFLAIGDLVQSSLRFRAAAEGMSEVRAVAAVDRAHFLSPEELTFIGTGRSRYYQHISSLYESQRLFSYVVDFSSLALAHSNDTTDLASSLASIDRRKAAKDSPVANRIEDTMEEIRILKVRERMEEIQNHLFNALVQTGRFKEAWACLPHLGDTRKSNLGTWIKKIVENDAVEVLLDVSLHKSSDALSQEVDAALLGLAKKAIGSRSSTPYHQILYAFRTQRSDFRGAAEILHEHLVHLRGQSDHMQDPEDETIVHAYVLLINTLACCGEEDAWLLAEASDTKSGKRKLVTLADVRREYTAELDRRSDVLMGRFPLVGGDEMDVL